LGGERKGGNYTADNPRQGSLKSGKGVFRLLGRGIDKAKGGRPDL